MEKLLIDLQFERPICFEMITCDWKHGPSIIGNLSLNGHSAVRIGIDPTYWSVLHFFHSLLTMILHRIEDQLSFIKGVLKKCIQHDLLIPGVLDLLTLSE